MDVLNFVIVGHVDHGKSTLIGRLLYDTDSLPPDKIEEVKKISSRQGRETEFAYLLDHLEEERQQGITIDTTQVFFRTSKREYVIIDAPGHVEFVKNMVTGASQAEAAVLIVDAKEGVKEQTKRHSYILSLLGLRQVIVVINKMDLVDFSRERFDQVKRALEEFLGGLHIHPDLYIPICALRGDNVAQRSERMGWYDGPTFLDSLDALENVKPSEEKALLFPIQDVYKIEDKRIAVGRVEAGAIHAGQKIKILPQGGVTTVRSIERFLENRTSGYAGESIGIVTEDSVFLNRGDVVCALESSPTLTDRFWANVFWMSKETLKKNERITIRCATQKTTAKVESITNRMDPSTLEVLEQDAEALCNLDVARIAVKTKTPLVVTSFNDVRELGRFVFVRDDNTCAGGIIT